jgi:hypothetical protein
VKPSSLAAATVAAALLAAGTSAHGRERRHALVIGYNGVPGSVAPGTVAPLRYADDDAFAFYQLEREMGQDAVLLTVADSETRRRYPALVDQAQPPTLSQLARSISRLTEAIEQEARAGDTPVLTFFYSGHGAVDESGEPSLTLLDGPLSRRLFYEQVLDKVPARIVHVVVDACHADALVRFRDVNAASVVLSPDQVDATLAETTRAHYPQVGFVIATGGSADAFEWDRYGSGVFTHEVISGLRGAADVNGDGRVEYSELAAFVAAANREVQDPRARLQTIIEAPSVAGHVSLAEPGRGPTAGHLVGIPASVGSFFVEDLRGNRLVDGFSELGFEMSIALPSDEKMFVRSGDREAELVLAPGAERPFALLGFRQRAFRARDAVESSLRSGLFGAPYGPAYYRGYVDRTDAVAVNTLRLAPAASVTATKNESQSLPPPSPPPRRPLLRWALGGTGAALVASSAVFGGLAWRARMDYDSTNLQAQAAGDRDRYRTDGAVAIGLLVTGTASLIAAALTDRGR